MTPNYHFKQLSGLNIHFFLHPIIAPEQQRGILYPDDTTADFFGRV